MDFIIESFKYMFTEKEYVWYDKPFQLNVFSIRSKDRLVNKFDDHMFVIYKDNKNKWWIHQWACTTDPGLKILLNPPNRKGAAILAPGQYKDAYAIDLHKRRYPALCQRKGNVTVYRDNNRNAVHDFEGTIKDTGMFGINIHKAGIDSTQVDGWSAGCTVFKRVKDFDEFMTLCRKHKQSHGNTFTYSLFDEAAL